MDGLNHNYISMETLNAIKDVQMDSRYKNLSKSNFI